MSLAIRRVECRLLIYPWREGVFGLGTPEPQLHYQGSMVTGTAKV